MNDEMLKVNILTITVAGFLMLLTGVFLYMFRNFVYDNLRFFLPIPPLGVAAYIFVFNLFNYYRGDLPGNVWDTARELIYSAVASGVVFCVFITANLALTYWLKKIF